MSDSPSQQRTRTWSIGTHLIVLAIVPMLSALLTTAGIIGYLDINAIRRTKAEQLLIQAEMVAFNSAEAVAEHDEATAQRQLAAIRAQSDVRMGCLLDSEGDVVARFSSVDALSHRREIPSWTGYRQIDDNLLAVVCPVIYGGKTIGHVYVLAETEDAARAVARYVLVLLLVISGAVTLSWWFASRLQRKIARPIANLADIARVIAREDNFALRAPLAGPTEARDLASTFNQMLQEVATSRASLQAAAEELEAKVIERTRQLSNEIQRRKCIEVDLRESKAAADAANEAKSTFVANISHEIRTPLNGILGFTKLLLSDDGRAVDAAKRRDFLCTIDRSGEQLLSLINDVLDLSKVESGRLDVEHVACQPIQIINDVVQLCRIRAEEKGITLAHVIEAESSPEVNDWLARNQRAPLSIGGVPGRILSDPARLRQIIMNLVSNAVKFSPPGVVTVASRLTVEGDAPKLEIAVRDHGIGIPAEKCEAIFEPFVQADASTTRKFGGTGLGLAISRRFAEALGGTLTVISEVGVGSTFRLRLPLDVLDETQLVQDPRLVDSRSSISASGEWHQLVGRVLVVDDGDTNRKFAQAVLERCGLQISLAENGEEALRSVEANRFDVILMDVQMPVMDGHSATARMRAAGIQTPIIAITAAAMPGDIHKCLDVGCTDYLTKPFAPAALVEKVSRYLDSSQGPPIPLPMSVAEPASDATEQNTSRLVSQLPMDDPVFRLIVRQFVDTLRERILLLETAVKEESWNDVTLEAHWLKGAAGTVGFPAFTAPAGEISGAAKRADLSGALAQLATIKQLADSIECPA